MKHPTSAQLYIDKGYAVFHGLLSGTAEHAHHALEIFIGIDGPVRIHSQRRVQQGSVLLVDADIPHRMPDASGRTAIIILDPEGSMALHLKNKFLMRRGVADPGGAIDIGKVHTALLPGKAGRGSVGPRLYQAVTAPLSEGTPPVPEPDERIRRVQRFLRGLPSKKKPLSALAAAAHLSEGRLVHLFKEQVGIPLRRYQLWLRLIDAVDYILQGRPLTEAAHQAEFSDYAHLSRTFSRMFGYSLSDIFKKRDVIEIITAGNP